MRPTLRDARVTEQLERKQRLDRERRATSKHVEQLAVIRDHARQVASAHRAARGCVVHLGRLVLDFHQVAETAEQKRVERIAKERIRALKTDDEEAYRRADALRGRPHAPLSLLIELHRPASGCPRICGRPHPPLSSGDLRNLIRTVNSLPWDYAGYCDNLLNDTNPVLINRNLVILFVLLSSGPSIEEDAEFCTHLMYSAALPEVGADYVKRCINFIYASQGEFEADLSFRRCLDTRGEGKVYSVQPSAGIKRPLEMFHSNYSLCINSPPRRGYLGLSSPYLDGWGYGEVVPDGYGRSYAIEIGVSGGP
ncbi:hypothetical protein B0H14DRAFT_3622315 [Mycena olivaceomarginata]|nr:hypothetical protein B0H14DRAFT_3622315 [Mycena olivaceomarginata]